MLGVEMRYLRFPTSVSTMQGRITRSDFSLRHPRHRGGLSAVALACVLLTTLPGVAMAQGGSNPFMVLPQHGDNGEADTLFLVDLGNGRIDKLDQLRRQMDRGRRGALSTNLFSEMGRPADQPAGLGEVFLGPIQAADGSVRSALLVEASTGYTLYFDQLGKGGALGRATTMIKRGFEPIASTDGNFVLLMQRNGSGKTEGAFLFHGTTGAAMHLGDLDELEIDPPSRNIAGLPAMGGWVTGAPILVSEETVSYVVIDNADGQVHFFDLAGGNLAHRKSNIALREILLAEQYNPSVHRFVPVPLQNSDLTTTAVMIVDVGTGSLALLDGLRQPTQTLGQLPQNVYSAIRGGLRTDATRWLTVVDANDAAGETRGLWIHDSLTDSIAFVESPAQPAQIKVRRMVVER